jgi:hypothetical protein
MEVFKEWLVGDAKGGRGSTDGGGKLVGKGGK